MELTQQLQSELKQEDFLFHNKSLRSLDTVKPDVVRDVRFDLKQEIFCHLTERTHFMSKNEYFSKFVDIENKSRTRIHH